MTLPANNDVLPYHEAANLRVAISQKDGNWEIKITYNSAVTTHREAPVVIFDTHNLVKDWLTKPLAYHGDIPKGLTALVPGDSIIYVLKAPRSR